MFEIRWSNGYWKLFDVERYKSVALFGLKREAEEALLKANA
jgi:hypothetical protein